MNKEDENRIAAMQEVIKKLRSDDLNQGHCFMIFDDELPPNQAYYEYPDGSINIEQLDESNLDKQRTIIRILSDQEIITLKDQHDVFQ